MSQPSQLTTEDIKNLTTRAKESIIHKNKFVIHEIVYSKDYNDYGIIVGYGFGKLYHVLIRTYNLQCTIKENRLEKVDLEQLRIESLQCIVEKGKPIYVYYQENTKLKLIFQLGWVPFEQRLNYLPAYSFPSNHEEKRIEVKTTYDVVKFVVVYFHNISEKKFKAIWNKKVKNKEIQPSVKFKYNTCLKRDLMIDLCNIALSIYKDIQP